MYATILFSILSLVFGIVNIEACVAIRPLHFSDWSPNLRLQGHSFLSYGPSGRILCKKKCDKYPECRSVNFNTESLVCELNDENSTTTPAAIGTKPFYMYSEKEMSKVQYPESNSRYPPSRCIDVGNGEYSCMLYCPTGTLISGKSCVCPIGTHYKKANRYGAHNCEPCTVGYYQDMTGQGQCKECLVGHYQDEVGETGCKQCLAGHYTNATGQEQCDLCPKGYYQNKAGSIDCIPCSAGKYQNKKGMTSCSNCPAGRYQSGTGKTSCSRCSTGSYQNNAGQSACKPCQPGTYQNQKGQTSCKQCEPLTYGPDSGLKNCLTCLNSIEYGSTFCD